MFLRSLIACLLLLPFTWPDTVQAEPVPVDQLEIIGSPSLSVGESLRGGIWLRMANGDVVQVGQRFMTDLRSGRNRDFYFFRDGKGALIAPDRAKAHALITGFERADSSGYMGIEPVFVDQMLAYRAQMADMADGTKRVAFWSTFQSYCFKIEGILLGALTTSWVTVGKNFPALIRMEIEDQYAQAPERVLRRFALSVLQDGIALMDQQIDWAGKRMVHELGQSAQKPLDLAEIDAAYRRAILIDAYLLSAANYIIETRKDQSAMAQIGRGLLITGQSTGNATGVNGAARVAVGAVSYNDIISTAIKTYPAFKRFAQRIDARKAVWAQSRAGDGLSVLKGPFGWVVPADTRPDDTSMAALKSLVGILANTNSVTCSGQQDDLTYGRCADGPQVHGVYLSVNDNISEHVMTFSTADRRVHVFHVSQEQGASTIRPMLAFVEKRGEGYRLSGLHPGLDIKSLGDGQRALLIAQTGADWDPKEPRAAGPVRIRLTASDVTLSGDRFDVVPNVWTAEVERGETGFPTHAVIDAYVRCRMAGGDCAASGMPSDQPAVARVDPTQNSATASPWQAHSRLQDLIGDYAAQGDCSIDGHYMDTRVSISKTHLRMHESYCTITRFTPGRDGPARFDLNCTVEGDEGQGETRWFGLTKQGILRQVDGPRGAAAAGRDIARCNGAFPPPSQPQGALGPHLLMTGANFRAGPSTEFPKRDVGIAGERVDVLKRVVNDSGTEWAQIRYRQGRKAFVSARLLGAVP
ncbi:MAG: SH3 domain-containing protein [Pelagimonas sp.]|jgi:hypothetical protein|nr:SH3 domain-containing protein [Pelagimonas sp.]